MKNVLSIVNTKPSDLEFEVNIDGFEPSKVEVCLCIKTKDYFVKLPCKKNKSNWECHIPALNHLEKGAYPYVIEVVADGYHFEAMTGIANLAGSFDVYVKKPEKLIPGEVEKKEDKKVAKKVEPKEEKKVYKKVEPIKKGIKKEDLDIQDKKFALLVDKIFSKRDSNEEKKQPEPLVEDKNQTDDDIVKKIVSGSKKGKEVKDEVKLEEIPTILETSETSEMETSKTPELEKVEETKKEEPTVDIKKPDIPSKVGVIKKIVSETKNTKVKLPPKKKDEVKPIIIQEDPTETKKKVVSETKKKGIKQKVEPKSERDDNVKDILKNLSNPKIQNLIEETPLKFKKGRRVVH